jgi:hypothetical protein
MPRKKPIAVDTASALDQVFRDFADGKPAGQAVKDAHKAVDRAEAAGVTADDIRPHRRFRRS